MSWTCVGMTVLSRRNAARGALLLTALTPHGSPPAAVRAIVAAGDLDWLPRAAEHHGVTPALHRSLRDLGGIPPSVTGALERGFHAAAHGHLSALSDLAVLDEAFRASGVRWLVLKGPVFAERYYDRNDPRSYGDIDVLVAPGDLAAAIEALLSIDSRLEDRWTDDPHLLPGELAVQLPSGRWVDLHWHLLNQPRLRACFRISIAPLFEAARPITLGGRPYRSLGVADTIAHLLVHSCLSGGDRLIWVKDLDRSVTVEQPDWGEVAAVLRSWRAPLLGGVFLRRVGHTTADPQWEAAVRRVVDRSSTWLALSGRVDRHFPMHERSGQGSLARMVARSSREDDRSSFMELRRRLVANARDRRRAPGEVPAVASTAPADGRESRAAFLAAVDQALDEERG